MKNLLDSIILQYIHISKKSILNAILDAFKSIYCLLQNIFNFFVSKNINIHILKNYDYFKFKKNVIKYAAKYKIFKCTFN